MQDLGRSIDVWLGELARLRRSARTRDKYRRHLIAFADTLPNYTAVSEITADDCRLFLDRWIDAEPSTIGADVERVTIYLPMDLGVSAKILTALGKLGFDFDRTAGG